MYVEAWTPEDTNLGESDSEKKVSHFIKRCGVFHIKFTWI